VWLGSGGSLDIRDFADLEAFRKAVGTDSVMLARAPMWNPSVFRKEGSLPLDVVVKDYLRAVMDYVRDVFSSQTKVGTLNSLSGS